MPRARTTGRLDAYNAIRVASMALGERNDCAVVAAAAVTGTDYAKVHEIMAQLGRKAHKGTEMWITRETLRLLGYRMEYVRQHDVINQYPDPHKALRHVTTHHPERFNRVWADGNTYLLRTNGHILAVVNGQNVDWTRGRSLRVVELYRVVKDH